MYLTIKTIHICAAVLTFSGFILRGTWMLRRSPMLERKIVRILPHAVDSIFLLTGIWLIWLLRLQIAEQPWLIAKLVALVAYVSFGMIALRRGRTMGIRAAAFLLAVLTFTYIVGVALTKSISSWVVFVV